MRLNRKRGRHDFVARLEQFRIAESPQHLDVEDLLHRALEPQERDTLADYAKEYGLPNACRVILNLNEFVFVD